MRQTGAQLLAAVPAAPGRPRRGRRPRRAGRRCWPGCWPPPFALDNAGSQQIAPAGRAGRGELAGRRSPARRWQHRWQASGAEDQPDWRDADHRRGRRQAAGETAAGSALAHLSPGLLVLICADVIRPSLGWLLHFAAGAAQPGRRDGPHPRPRRRSPSSTGCARPAPVGLQVGQQALTRIGVIMAAKGGPVADVQVGDCLELLQLAAASGHLRYDAHARSPLFYQLLHARGVLGQDAPAAIQVFSGRGQPSCEQLIDRYRHRAAGRCGTCWSTTCANGSPRWTSPPCSAAPTCSASCSGPTWRPTTPASTR